MIMYPYVLYLHHRTFWFRLEGCLELPMSVMSADLRLSSRHFSSVHPSLRLVSVSRSKWAVEHFEKSNWLGWRDERSASIVRLGYSPIRHVQTIQRPHTTPRAPLSSAVDIRRSPIKSSLYTPPACQGEISRSKRDTVDALKSSCASTARL